MKKVKKKLTVVFISSEAAPYSKTGGLADVAGALPKALAALGHETHLITPLYKTVDRKKFKIQARGKRVTLPIATRKVEGQALSMAKNGPLQTHFIEQNDYFGRDHLYNTTDGDYHDNVERFVFFCRAALEAVKKMNIKPDIIHVNDWQTSLVPVYLKTIYKNDPVLGKVPCMLTIHNLGYQGRTWKYDWYLTGLDYSLFSGGQLEFFDDLNLLKGGISFADLITTVSTTYATEIQTAKMGHGLDATLRERSADIVGVLNGIDNEEWNPKTDPHVPANFSADDLSGKSVCKAKLLAEMGLPQGEGPLLAVVSRLANQKGLGLLIEVIEKIVETGAKLVMLGSGDKNMEKTLLRLTQKWPEAVAVKIGYNEGLAHRIEAGADMFLMPSLYEPCGLNQMYSLAYATAPIVRATGGLNDTVTNYNIKTGIGNGFKFAPFTPKALLDKTLSAIHLMENNREKWRKMIVDGMREDHSWSRSANVYVELYKGAIRK